MRSFLLLSFLCSIGYLTSAKADIFQSNFCKDALLSAETFRNEEVYSTCGFDDEKRAFSEWAVWAEQQGASQALYEICVRHPKNSKAERFCKKSMELGNASALVDYANKLYNKGDYTQAAEFYTKALSVTPSLLTDIERGKIAQNMGLLYMNPSSSYYNPQKGLPLIQKSAGQRGAEANNLMGVYSMFGMNGVAQNPKEAFSHFWVAILLGCPSAEENLGLFLLGHQKSIKNQVLEEEMKKRMFSCVPPPEEVQEETQIPQDCDCNKALEWNKNYGTGLYRLVRVNGDTATIKDETGDEIIVEKNSQLSNGTKVLEVQETSLIVVDKNFNRSIMKIAPSEVCLNACLAQKNDKPKKAIIPRYRLKFTQKECSDILYYAEQLVDTSLPFTGKVECGFSQEMGKTADLLMKL